MQPFVRARMRACVCVGGAVKDLVRLSAFVAASNRWRVIDCTICTKHHTPLSTPILYVCVCVGGGGEGSDACVATFKRWHLIVYTISTNNLIIWPIFLQSGHIIIEKL